jgi:hypothetical protein
MVAPCAALAATASLRPCAPLSTVTFAPCSPCSATRTSSGSWLITAWYRARAIAVRRAYAEDADSRLTGRSSAPPSRPRPPVRIG